MRSRIASALLAMLVITSVLAGAVGPALAQDSGYVGVPDSNVTEDLPSGSSVELAPSDLQGSVMASDHADSLQVVITTPERAADYVNGSQVGSGDVALVFKDDSEHEGRTVAVPSDAIRQAVGHLPNVVHGVHEDGTEWTSQVRAENGLLYFDVPKFSSNSVTFSGTVEITATPATDGSSFSYDLSGTDSVSDPVVYLTGRMNTESDNVSATGLADGSTLSTDVAGSTAPIGPSANSEPVVTFGGTTDVIPLSILSDLGDGTVDNSGKIAGDYNDDRLATSWEFTPNESGTLTEVAIPITSTNGGDTGTLVDVYVSQSGADNTYQEGTKVAEWDPDWSTGTQTVSFSTPVNVSAGSTYEIEFVTQSADSDSARDELLIDVDTSPSTVKQAKKLRDSGNTVTYDRYGDLNFTIEQYATDPALDIDGDGTDEATVSGQLKSGESATREIASLGLSDDTATVSTSVGTVNVSVKFQERTQTIDPTVELNNNTKSYSGTLADGETTSLTFDNSTLKDGTNRLNVSVGDGTLSSDAPDPVVDLEYSHEASRSISTEYFSDGLAERYNVSNTFSATQTNPTLRVPFSSTVYRLAQLEWSINDGSWSSVPDSRYSWENNTLVVELRDGDTDGDVDAGTKIEVRTEGRMVDVQNGKISVPEPTDPDAAEIDSKIRIESRSNDLNIVVGSGERLHYAYDESWNTVEDSSVVEADGTQRIYLPNADAGDTAWITTAPLEVVPQSGDVRVRVTDPDGPTIKLSGGPSAVGDDVQIRYYAVTDGESYEAYSVSRDRPIAKDTAEDGVATFSVDDSEETIRLQLAGSDSGESSEPQIGGGNWPDPDPGRTLQEIGVVVAWAALVVLLVAATGRSEVAGRRRWIIVGAVSLGTGLLSIEVLRPGTISTAIGTGLQDVVPLAGLAGIAIVGYSIYSWWQSRQTEAATPDTSVNFNLRGNE